MGSCVSAHKNSALKLVTFGSKRNKVVNPASPIKYGHAIPEPSNTNPPIKSGDRDFGGREENFFDSQTWLESDCEDDFFSVNGDFTPSRGNTPVHDSFSLGSPRPNKPSLEEQQPPGSESLLSPKKKLVELFKESLDEEQEENSETKTKIIEIPARSAPETPYVSVSNSLCSSERPINGDSAKKDKPLRSVHGCIPRLVSCRSFTERRRKMSPAIA